MRLLLYLLLLALSLPNPARADEAVRQVQEELRKRNLYFGTVDGRDTPELAAALKRYQKRKGFAASGSIDAETASSLNIQTAAVAVALPDVPVLKSDTASAMPESQRLALLREAEEKADLTPTPPPPAESPAPGQDLTPERVNKLVEDYLRDGETQDVASQLKYYAFPVRYFDHGVVSEKFVADDTRKYVQRWPERKYRLVGPVTFYAAAAETLTNLEFTIAFELRSDSRTTKNKASGRTKNWWSVRPDGEDLKIVAIREERLRE